MNENALDFQQIYNDFYPKIQRYLTRMVGEYEAEDLTQEVFVKISQALPTFRHESQLSTWIYRIATNTALDRLRTLSYQRTVQSGLLNVFDLDEVGTREKTVEVQNEVPLLEQQLCDKERYECYCDFVKNLPANYRIVVALSELEELATREIADILGLSMEAVKIRLHRGRTRLLQDLKTHCKPEDWL